VSRTSAATTTAVVAVFLCLFLDSGVSVASAFLITQRRPLAADSWKLRRRSRPLLFVLEESRKRTTAGEKQQRQKPQQKQPAILPLTEVDVLYGRKTSLVYDPSLDRFVDRVGKSNGSEAHIGIANSNVTASAEKKDDYDDEFGQSFLGKVLSRLSVAFLPSGVTRGCYYRFMGWRIAQRFINANLHVFGTQSLLLGLGMKSSRTYSSSSMLGLSAALLWVLKDALGKIARMVWASKMGGRFDSDAKRWRFRSSFVFAMGNGLEILAFICPPLFLVWATLANCCKQISMLTSSSTRTAIYNSFRDGTTENIGDIIAKGEAQIAIVDLLGIGTGVCLSRSIGTSIRKVVAVYLSLQTMEIFCMYRQLRCVQYRVLNFERMTQVIAGFCDTVTAEGTVNGKSSDVSSSSGSDDSRAATFEIGNGIPTPQQMAKTERIFLPPKHLSRRKNAFGSLGRAKLSPDELKKLILLFRRERFLLVVGADVKNHRPRRQRSLGAASAALHRQERCHIVLHEEATNKDIVKSTLALTFLRRRLANAHHLDLDLMRSSECIDLIEDAYKDCDRTFSRFRFLRQLSKRGWESPARFMFGRVHMRAYWPLEPPSPATRQQ